MSHMVHAQYDHKKEEPIESEKHDYIDNHQNDHSNIACFHIEKQECSGAFLA